MTIELGASLIPTVQAKVTPKQIVANRILAMSSVELQAAIAEELDDNPALELIEEATCPTCGGATFGGICPSCSPKADGPTGPTSTSRDRVRRATIRMRTTRSRERRRRSPCRSISTGTCARSCHPRSTRSRRG